MNENKKKFQAQFFNFFSVRLLTIMTITTAKMGSYAQKSESFV